MSYIIWIVIGVIALFIATKVVGRRSHIVVPAVLAIASLGWTSPSTAAPSDAGITTSANSLTTP